MNNDQNDKMTELSKEDIVTIALFIPGLVLIILLLLSNLGVFNI